MAFLLPGKQVPACCHASRPNIDGQSGFIWSEIQDMFSVFWHSGNAQACGELNFCQLDGALIFVLEHGLRVTCLRIFLIDSMTPCFWDSQTKRSAYLQGQQVPADNSPSPESPNGAEIFAHKGNWSCDSTKTPTSIQAQIPISAMQLRYKGLIACWYLSCVC